MPWERVKEKAQETIKSGNINFLLIKDNFLLIKDKKIVLLKNVCYTCINIGKLLFRNTMNERRRYYAM